MGGLLGQPPLVLFVYLSYTKSVGQVFVAVVVIPVKPMMEVQMADYSKPKAATESVATKSVSPVETSKPGELLKQPYHVYPGSKIKFFNEVKSYTVRCNSERFTIVTKPFNPEHTVLYTIIDWKEQRRGPENLVFGMGAETTEECLEMLVRLLDGRTGRSDVSYRHDVPLNWRYGVEWVKNDKEFVYRADTEVNDLELKDD